jgi:hypothetical protein
MSSATYIFNGTIPHWYQDGRLVSQSKKELRFGRTPYTIWTHRPAGALGLGHFSVSTSVDGMTVSTSDFEIKT